MIDAYDFPIRKVWMRGVTPKVTHFLRLVFRKQISTIDNLRKRGQILVNRCSLCYKAEELVDNLCQIFPFIQEVWKGILGEKRFEFGIDIIETISKWPPDALGKGEKRIWAMLLPHVLWEFWKERNKRIFQEKVMTVEILTRKIHCMIDEN